jgi:hypothetical protein
MSCVLHKFVCAGLQPPPMEQQTPTGGARMSLGGKSVKKPVPAKLVTSIIDGLKQIYFNKVMLSYCCCSLRKRIVFASLCTRFVVFKHVEG